jgi:hypothetical protein
MSDTATGPKPGRNASSSPGAANQHQTATLGLLTLHPHQQEAVRAAGDRFRGGAKPHASHHGEALWGIPVEIDLDAWPLVKELLPLLEEIERVEAMAAGEAAQNAIPGANSAEDDQQPENS